MKGRDRIVSIIIAAIVGPMLSLGCGVKSAPIPPEYAVPERIATLNALSEKTGVRLSWERPERTAGGRKMRNLGSFDIERAENTETFDTIAQIPLTDLDRFQQEHRFSYLDSGAQVGHHYRYQVISETLDAYRSAPSNLVQLTHQLPPPPPNPEDFVLPQPKPLP
ncbi:MAG TPA: hypothetical protein VN867_13395 [Candidatus Binataceae bacterium]|jgi:hypothetical protein|nr:hypothetical protein [Candidatus Binataceae bacterium]